MRRVVGWYEEGGWMVVRGYYKTENARKYLKAAENFLIITGKRSNC